MRTFFSLLLFGTCLSNVHAQVGNLERKEAGGTDRRAPVPSQIMSTQRARQMLEKYPTRLNNDQVTTKALLSKGQTIRGDYADLDVFYPGDSQSGACWAGLVLDTLGNVYPNAFGSLQQLAPDGSLPDGLGNYYITSSGSFFMSLDTNTNMLWSASFSSVEGGPFKKGSRLKPIYKGFNAAVAVVPGAGLLNNYLIVSEFTQDENAGLRKINTTTGEISILAKGMSYPEAVACAANGTIYTVDLFAVPATLWKTTPEGNTTVFATTEGQSFGFRGLAVDQAGRVYWSQSNGINVYSAEGEFLYRLQPPQDNFINPMGMQIDRSGQYLYVVDNGFCRLVYRYTLKVLGIASFTLLNASTNRDIQELKDGDVIDLAVFPPNTKLNIRANTLPAQVGSVVLQLTGAETYNQTSNDLPYWLFGEGSSLSTGEYQLTATPYSAADGSGTKGTPLRIHFTISSAELTTWYRDADGDGFGDPARSVTSVTQPPSYVANNQDCNDYRVYYEDRDNDGWGNSAELPCGTITRTGDCDDNNNKVHSQQTFYRDADGDSYGNKAVTTVICSSVPPAGYVKNSIDCNDQDPLVHGPVAYYRDADGDGFGDSTNKTAVCSSTPPTGYVRNTFDCDDHNALLHSGCPTTPGCPTPSFAPVTTYPLPGFQTGQITAADFNSDNKLDLAVVSASSISVLLNRGDGSFGAPASFALGVVAYSLASADFNGDGKMDLLIGGLANHHQASIAVLLGKGDGSFEPATTSSIDCLATVIAPGDYNQDGKVDLAMGCQGSVAVLLGNGDGSFRTYSSFPAGGNDLSGIAMADFNGDGRLDLALANSFPSDDGTLTYSYLSIQLGKGDGSFEEVSAFSVMNKSRDMTAGDYNGDGLVDLAVVNEVTNDVAVFLGKGNGSFGTATVFVTDGIPYSIAAGDYNGDGRVDLAVANGREVGVLLNTCGTVLPTVTTPQHVNLVAAGKVPFGGEQEMVSTFTLSASPNPVKAATRIQYTVPVDAHVNIKVCDILGREVNTVYDGWRSAGTYTQDYNAAKLPSGVYYLRMVATAGGKDMAIKSQKLVKGE